MNGVHDVGGMQCFGAVRPEPDEPVFHAEWEGRVLALTLATGALGAWNIDQSRSARESLPPAVYLSSSYYRIWFEAPEGLLGRSGLLDGGFAARARTWPEMKSALDATNSFARETDSPPQFAVGDRVRARMIHPAGHTRLPRFVRGQVGTIVLVHGSQVFPDRDAVPIGEPADQTPEWIYAVEFSGTDLWGPDSDPTVTVCVDAWEPYLEAAS